MFLLWKFAAHADISLWEIVGPGKDVDGCGLEVLGIEVLGMVPDVLGHEGADEVVAVVIALKEEKKYSYLLLTFNLNYRFCLLR